MMLTEELVRHTIFISYVAYFSAAGVAIVLYAVEQSVTLLATVCLAVPLLHFCFILLGMWLRSRVDVLAFYEPYPDIRVPRWVLYASDWGMAVAFGMSVVLFIPVQPQNVLAFASAGIVMCSQIVCFFK